MIDHMGGIAVWMLLCGLMGLALPGSPKACELLTEAGDS